MAIVARSVFSRFYCFKRGPQRLECLSDTKGREHPELPARNSRKLREYYAPYNKLFFDLVGRDFGWNDVGKEKE